MTPKYPSMRDAADKHACIAQRRYFAATTAQLSLISASALVAGLNTKSPHDQSFVAWSVCVLMFLTLVTSLVLKVGRFEVRWFKCRAFAETAKSLVWQYVMAVDDPTKCNETAYVREWVDLENRLPELHREFAISSPDGDLVTTWMTSVLKLELPEKINLYLKRRLNDQRDWYSDNARKNAALHERWFWAVFVLEAAAILYAALQAWRLLPLNLVGFVVSTGACFLVWSQAKRFSDLATTYAVAAEDLSQIAFRYRDANDQETVNKLVRDVEDAVSREHSMWLAKRVGFC